MFTIPLITPAGFADAYPHFKAKVCNGTGAAGTPRLIVFFLETLFLLGLNIRPASDRHDWGYYFACTIWGKIWADIVFFVNICILAVNACFTLPLSDAVGNILFLPIRIVFRALLYSAAVFIFGWFAWKPGHGHKIPKQSYGTLLIIVSAVGLQFLLSGCSSILPLIKQIAISGIYANGSKIEEKADNLYSDTREKVKVYIIEEKAKQEESETKY